MTLLLLLACTRDYPSKDADDGDAEGAATLQATPDALSWGPLLPGEAGDEVFTLTNLGPGPVDAALSIDGDAAWTMTPAAVSLQEAESIEIVVTFAGASAGSWAGQLTATSTDPEDNGATVTLSALVAVDADGDGWTEDQDCDDADASVNPGADETWYDGIDQDCAGDNDWDQDGDLWGLSGDCDDTNPGANPGAPEVAGNGIDDDCDGQVDETAPGGDVATGALAVVTGQEDGDHMGGALLFAAGLRGDATTSLLIGSGSADNGSSPDFGAIGAFDRTTLSGTRRWDSGWGYVRGNGPGDAVGSSLLALGDLDRTGGADLLIGAPGEDQGVVRRASLVGASGRFSLDTITGAIARGEGSGAAYGSALAGGDLDGDGHLDLVVGAPGQDGGAGRVMLQPWSDGWWATDALASAHGRAIRATSSDDALGEGVTAGDLDGDGYADAVMCAPGNGLGGTSAGACWVLDGASTLTVGGDVDDLASAVVLGSARGDQLARGYALGGVALTGALQADDLDHDGRAELAIGAPGSDLLAVFAGGSLVSSQTVATADWRYVGDDSFGSALATTRDVTGDGTRDVLVGAPGAAGAAGQVGAGAVYLLAGAGPRATRDVRIDGVYRWSGSAAGDALGAALAVGDLDGDGGTDLALTAPLSDAAGRDAGAVYLQRLR